MALTPSQRRDAETRVLHRLASWQTMRNARDVACYLAVNAEFPTLRLIHWLWRQGKRVYLPVLHTLDSHHDLIFQRFAPHTRLRRNRLRIREPVPNPRERVPAKAFDLVIAPLVGFDAAGNRLGMGGGYYDRSFEFLSRPGQGRPFLLGLAFATQHTESINAEAWDIPLNGVVTEQGLTIFRRRPHVR